MQHSSKTTERSYPQNSSDQFNELIPPIHNQPRSDEYQADCSKKENAPLCAQRRMAKSAKEQSLWTLISLGLLLLTLIAAAWAAWEARSAVAGVRDTNRITGDAFRTDQRPWLSFDMEITRFHLYHRPENGKRALKLRIDCDIVFKNNGKTPAQNVVFASMCIPKFRNFSEKVIRKEFKLNEDLEETIQQGFTLSPNGSFRKNRMHIVDIDDVISIGDGQFITPGYAIMASYDSGANDTHETIQAFSIMEERNTGIVPFNVGVTLAVSSMDSTPNIIVSRIGISRMT